jgi:glycosyltransferase involved in cell wall biosynthesis
MISGRDIIYISSIEWNFLWQGHQEIALRLAAAGNRVLYIENTGVRAPGLADVSRVAFRLKRWARALASSGVREVAPNIFLCSPLVLPPFGPRWQRTLNRRIFLPLVRRAARSLGMRDVLIWTYLPTDTTVDLIKQLRGPESRVVYYCVADFTQLTPHADQLRRSERETVELSDAVFTNCSELTNLFARWNPNTHVFPFGVNLDAFPLEAADASPTRDGAKRNGHPSPQASQPTSTQTGGAASLNGLPHPVVGYVGGLHRHVDFALLKRMAEARPGWSFVLVGSLQEEVGELRGLPNVHLLGQQPHRELAEYIRRFDVCIVPYVNSIYTTTVVPTKINEYLAMGKPVVSTDLPTVTEFNREHQVLLTATTEPEDFLRAVEDALALPKDAETIARRRRVASLGDWQARFAAMCALIETPQAGTGAREEKASEKPLAQARL